MRSRQTALRGILFTALALALLLAPIGLPGGSSTAYAKDSFELNISEDLPIEDFLRAVAAKTGKTLVWNPSDKNIRGKKIIGGTLLKGSADEFLSLARSLLTFYELVMIPVGPNGNDVILILDARQTSSILKLKPVYIQLTDENVADYQNKNGLYVTTSIHVENMEDLRNARNALTRIVTGQNIGNVTEVPSAKTFVVTDFAPNVCAIYRLLKEMDVPSAGSSTTLGITETITIEHGSAKDLARILASHFASSGPKGPVSPRSPIVPGPRAPRITADERTNKLLVTGSEEQIAKVKEVVQMLDLPLFQPDTMAHYVRLDHIRAMKAANTLTAFIESSPELWSGTLAPSVVSHDETNALLISAGRKAFDVLTRLISEMDSSTEEK